MGQCRLDQVGAGMRTLTSCRMGSREMALSSLLLPELDVKHTRRPSCHTDTGPCKHSTVRTHISWPFDRRPSRQIESAVLSIGMSARRIVPSVLACYTSMACNGLATAGCTGWCRRHFQQRLPVPLRPLAGMRLSLSSRLCQDPARDQSAHMLQMHCSMCPSNQRPHDRCADYIRLSGRARFGPHLLPCSAPIFSSEQAYPRKTNILHNHARQTITAKLSAKLAMMP